MKMAEDEDTLRETSTMNQSLPMERLESQVSIDAGPMSQATSSQDGESPGCIHPTNPGKLLTLRAFGLHSTEVEIRWDGHHHWPSVAASVTIDILFFNGSVVVDYELHRHVKWWEKSGRSLSFWEIAARSVNNLFSLYFVYL